jgi:hypothetical protein
VLSSLLYGVHSTDAVMFIAVSLVLVVVATLASYPPARRAMRRSHCGFALRIVGTWPGYHEPSPWGVAVTQDQLLVTSSVGRVRFGDCFEYDKTPLPATASLPALHGSLKSHVALCQTRQNLAEEKIGLGSTLHLPSPQFKPTKPQGTASRPGRSLLALRIV